MRTTQQHGRRRGGSAFILVVVVTVLLAVVGVMFVMVARVGEMGSSAVVDSTDLDVAVETVVSRINTALVADLFGADGVIGSDGPHYTWPGVARGDDPLTGDRINPWLASLEPNAVDNFRWEHITNLSNPPMPVTWDRIPVIVPEYQPAGQIVPGHYADAAGDGVADSIWIRLPNASTSRGKPVFAAIRIIDNCAMLNLNTANCFQINTVSGGAYDGWFYYNQLAGNTVLHNEVNTSVPANRLYFKDGGRYLSEVNYASFLRGSGTSIDNLYGILAAKRFAFLNPTTGNIVSQLLPPDFHQVLMKIENPKDIPTVGSTYNLFDIGDELEIRNRYLLTSRVLGRFEKEGVAYNTFDHSRGEFAGGWQGALRVKRVPYDGSEDVPWSVRLNPANFDGTGVPTPSHPFYYDRRHISTFYSFDRPLRTGQYPTFEMDAAIHGLTPAQRAVFVPDKAMPIDLRTADITDATTIVQLLYALREVYDAQKAAQIVVNLIDYVDSDNQVSVLDTDRIAAYILAAGDGLFGGAVSDEIAEDFGLGDVVVYGYERQPFISEIYCFRNTETGVVEAFALELVNPYRDQIDLNGWRVRVGTMAPFNLSGAEYYVPAATGDQPEQYGRLVIWSGSVLISGGGHSVELPGFGTGFLGNSIVRLQRPDPVPLDPADPYLTVDRTHSDQSRMMFDQEGGRSSKRDDRQWRFTNQAAFVVDSTTRIGRHNAVSDMSLKGYQLPVLNEGEPIERLADFIRVAFVSNTGGDDPNTITELIADAEDEADIRYDMEAAPDLLDYICFLNRPDQGSLPGRININTAALHVIAAAIPPQLVMAAADDAEHALYLAEQIVANRPYERVSDLLRINAFKKFTATGTPNVGDQGVEGDFEERDWIVSRLANIFTVRSDTFTAYILVRLGDDGPQRRMIAIFDRSQVWTPSDCPRLVALHPVPEAR